MIAKQSEIHNEAPPIASYLPLCITHPAGTGTLPHMRVG